MSLEQLVAIWRTRQRQEVNAAIREGLAEADAGLGVPLDSLMADFCEKNEVSPNV